MKRVLNASNGIILILKYQKYLDFCFIGGSLAYDKFFQSKTFIFSEEHKNNTPKDKDDDKEQAQVPKKKECKYGEVTELGSRYPNTETDVTQGEFEKELKKDGWIPKKSKDGKIDNYEKDGSRYAVRGFSFLANYSNPSMIKT